VLDGSKGERKLKAGTGVEPKVAIDEMHREGRECLDWRRDSGRLGDAKEGKGEASSLAKWVSERGRHWASGLQTREQGKSKADEKAGAERKAMWEGESREYKKGTSETRGSIYAARATGPCEDANLTERHTRSGRPPFPDAATASSTLH